MNDNAWRDLQNRVSRLEQQMQVLLEHFGINLPPQASDERFAAVLELVRRGQLIEAIKLYREQTGVGLAEAKTAVEAMKRHL